MAKRNRSNWYPAEGEDKVLVPLVGKEDQFKEAMLKAHQIAHGKLGWQGQAELMVEVGLDVALGLPKSKYRKVNVRRVMDYLKQAFLQDIAQYSEWLTREEAEKRSNSMKVLYGEKEPTEPVQS